MRRDTLISTLLDDVRAFLKQQLGPPPPPPGCFATQVLKWKRVDAYSEASGGRWDMSMTSRPAAPEEVGKED